MTQADNLKGWMKVLQGLIDEAQYDEEIWYFQGMMSMCETLYATVGGLESGEINE